MARAKFHPDILTERLAVHTYSASEVVSSAGITASILTNYLTKSRLVLCSNAGGRGRSRRFELIDIYAISLVHDLVNITGNQNWSCRLIEYLLFSSNSGHGNVFMPIEKYKEFPKRKSEVKTSIRMARPLFYERNWMDTAWILFMEKADVAAGICSFTTYCAGSQQSIAHNDTFLLGMDKGYLLNVTFRLRQLDQRISEIVGEEK